MKNRFLSLIVSFNLILSIISFVPITSYAASYIWPLVGYTTITSGFGYRIHPISGEWEGHGGIDIGSDYNVLVYASSSGQLYIGYTGCTHNGYGTCDCGGGYGNYVIIADDNGMNVYYAHLTSVTASAGRINQGQQIGTIGSTGISTGPHLHFEMRTGSAQSTRVDPLNYVSSSNTGNYQDVTPPEPPANVFVNVLGSKVAVSWDFSQNATSYDVYLMQAPWGWSDIKYSQSISGEFKYCVFHGVAPGDYVVFVVARPNADYVQSERISISVGVPTTPTINPVVPYHSVVGENVTISWNDPGNTEKYLYYLTEYPTGHAYQTNTTSDWTTNTSVTFNNLTAGNYSLFIHAANDIGLSPRSEWVSFNVDEYDYVPTKTVVYNNHIYALYDYEMAWDYAKDLSECLGGHLVTITSAEENQIIKDLIQQGSKDAYWLGATDITEFSTTTFNEKVYTWITGEQFSYSDWADGQPDSCGEYGAKEHFAEIRKSFSNQWNDASNTSKDSKGFILEVEINNYSPIVTEIFNGNKYMLFDKNTTWSEAKVFCEQLGGHLATAGSNAENDFLKSFIESGERAWYYIGGQKQNGIWKWLDGSSVSTVQWTSWAESWPGTNLMMYKTMGSCTGLYNAYYPVDIKNIGFVCEIDNYYMLPPHTETQVVKTGNAYNISVSQTNLETAKIIVAGYKSNKISDMKILNNDNLKTTFTGDFDTFKVMAWENRSTLKPLCEAETIPQNKWIIE